MVLKHVTATSMDRRVSTENQERALLHCISKWRLLTRLKVMLVTFAGRGIKGGDEGIPARWAATWMERTCVR